MEELTGIFVGYKEFNSKSGKHCYVISLIFIELDDVNQCAKYFVKDIFTTEEKYDDFVQSNKLLQQVDVKREIVGDFVRYYI